MNGELAVLAVVVGLGTWAFRYVPLWWRTSPRAKRRAAGEGGAGAPAEGVPGSTGSMPAGAVGRFLGGIGVAAVAALAASSLWPYLGDVLSAATGQPDASGAGAGGRPAASTGPWRTALPLAGGLGATVLAFLSRKSVVAATVLGATVYGLTSWLAQPS